MVRGLINSGEYQLDTRLINESFNYIRQNTDRIVAGLDSAFSLDILGSEEYNALIQALNNLKIYAGKRLEELVNSRIRH